MNAIVKSSLAWLIRREYWESRRGFLWAQVWAAAAILIITVLMIIALEALSLRSSNNGIQISTGLTQLLSNARAHDFAGVVNFLDFNMLTFGGIAATVLSFVVFFYLLGALYDDRRDRSTLFWKSLPLSDSSTVISKVIAAVVVAPLIAVGVTLAGFIAWQVIVSLGILAHGANPFTLIWAHTQPYAVWLHFLAAVPVNAVWALPTVGWLLFWSAAVRSKPFLWAVAIPVIAGVLNFWIRLLGLPHISTEFFWTQLVGRPLLSVIPGSWITRADMQQIAVHFQAHGDNWNFNTMSFNYAVIPHALMQPGMWIGAAVGIVLIAAAIWFRRWRDEV